MKDSFTINTSFLEDDILTIGMYQSLLSHNAIFPWSIHVSLQKNTSTQGPEIGFTCSRDKSQTIHLQKHSKSSKNNIDRWAHPHIPCNSLCSGCHLLQKAAFGELMYNDPFQSFGPQNSRHGVFQVLC